MPCICACFNRLITIKSLRPYYIKQMLVNQSDNPLVIKHHVDAVRDLSISWTNLVPFVCVFSDSHTHPVSSHTQRQGKHNVF